MSWLRRLKKFSLVIFYLWLSACGVKGDPLPPEAPPELGRGRPTYRRATEGIRIERQRPVKSEAEEDEDDEDEESE